VAIAGPPTAGKSTLAAALAARLGAAAAVVPMDGFHLDNTLLEARGLRARKGSPESFDAEGFLHAMRRLRDAPEVILPVFDRGRDAALAGALAVGPGTRIALVEGNYLLLDRPPWDALAPLWDLTVFLRLPLAEVERRAMARWHAHGWPEPRARAHVAGNDLPNARLVLEHSRPAELTF
jgi:pantothenate kinase